MEVNPMGFQIAPGSEGSGLRLRGELDIAGADALLEQVESVAGRNGSPNLYVDLAELTFIDSSGIRALIAASRNIRGKVVLLSPTPSVAKILDIVRVDTLPGLEIRPDGAGPFDGSDDGQSATPPPSTGSAAPVM